MGAVAALVLVSVIVADIAAAQDALPRLPAAAFDVILPVSFDPEATPADGLVLAGGVDIAISSFLSIQAGARIVGDNPKFTLGTVVALRHIRVSVNSTVDVLTGFNAADLLSVGSVIELGEPR